MQAKHAKVILLTLSLTQVNLSVANAQALNVTQPQPILPTAPQIAVSPATSATILVPMTGRNQYTGLPCVSGAVTGPGSAPAYPGSVYGVPSGGDCE